MFFVEWNTHETVKDEEEEKQINGKFRLVRCFTFVWKINLSMRWEQNIGMNKERTHTRIKEIESKRENEKPTLLQTELN